MRVRPGTGRASAGAAEVQSTVLGREAKHGMLRGLSAFRLRVQRCRVVSLPRLCDPRLHSRSGNGMHSLRYSGMQFSLRRSGMVQILCGGKLRVRLPLLTPPVPVQVLVDPRHQPTNFYKLIVELLKQHVVRIQPRPSCRGLPAYPNNHPEKGHPDGYSATDERCNHLASQHAQSNQGGCCPGSDGDAARFPVRATSQYKDPNEHARAGCNERWGVLPEPRGEDSLGNLERL